MSIYYQSYISDIIGLTWLMDQEEEFTSDLIQKLSLAKYYFKMFLWHSRLSHSSYCQYIVLYFAKGRWVCVIRS